MKKMDLVCLKCGRKYPYQFKTHCNKCDGALDIEYDLSRAKIYPSKNPFKRYFDILPIPSIKYAHYLGEGNTPLHHAKKLGNILGLSNLYLKLEGYNPTNTVKDRMAAVSLSYLKATGVTHFCLSSTGNTSTSYGYYISHFKEFNVDIFMNNDSIRHYRIADNEHICLYKVNGTYMDAVNCVKKYSIKESIVDEGGFFNIGRREGLKLAILESYEQCNNDFDWLFQSVSSGMGILASYKGINEFIALKKIKHQPKMVCCQQSTNAPMVHAFQAHSPTIRTIDIIKNPSGLAWAILRGDPTMVYPYIRDVVLKTDGTMEKASTNDILNAVTLVKKIENIEIGYAAAVSVACLINMVNKKRIGRTDKILINITDGGNKLPDVSPKWIPYKAN